MTKLYETHTADYSEDGVQGSEKIYVYANDDEDFELLSHNEQVSALGLPNEMPTPSKGTITRYFIDVSDFFIVVRETKMTW